MFYLSYFFPVVAMAIAIAVRGDWSEYWIGYVVGLLTVEGIIYLVFYLLSRCKEFVSGYVVSVVHHFAWVERVIMNETKTIDGKSVTRQKVEYRPHPDEWFRLLNTGKQQPTGGNYFYEMCQRWGNDRYPIAVHHPNLHSGGGGEQCDWNQYNEAQTDTNTYTQRYKNPIRHSNSIFRHSTISKKEARQIGLFDYPKIGFDDQTVILCHADVEAPTDLNEANRALQRLNAFCGKESQIHVFILLFPATAGMAVCQQQRDYWKGLNKNELVVCLGVNGERVEWSHAMSWMDSPVLDTTYRRYFLDTPVLRLTDFVMFMRDNMNLWQRKEFSDFRYLGTHFSMGGTLFYWILSLLLSAAILYVALK